MAEEEFIWLKFVCESCGKQFQERRYPPKDTIPEPEERENKYKGHEEIVIALLEEGCLIYKDHNYLPVDNEEVQIVLTAIDCPNCG